MANTLAEPLIRVFESADRAAIEEMAGEVVLSGEMFVYKSVGPVMDYWLGPEISTFMLVDEAGLALATYALKANQPGRGSHVANAGYMVHSRARGRGLGRLMCVHSIELAREMGFHSMQFNMVISTNQPAIRIWEELGFRVVGTLPKVFRHPTLGLVDSLVFYREL
jgi:ribosomal protein S18 acetylase RimI-like enzyme